MEKNYKSGGAKPNPLRETKYRRPHLSEQKSETIQVGRVSHQEKIKTSQAIRIPISLLENMRHLKCMLLMDLKLQRTIIKRFHIKQGISLNRSSSPSFLPSNQ